MKLKPDQSQPSIKGATDGVITLVKWLMHKHEQKSILKINFLNKKMQFRRHTMSESKSAKGWFFSSET